MRPLKLKVNNFCQHEGEHEWAFTGSVIGILGPNGTGKSNMLRAMEFAITGELNRPKNRIITFGQKTGSVDFEVEFSPGLIATIHRDLHRDKVTLTFESDSKLNVLGAKPVNQRILELLETDKTLLQELVFVAQESLAALLFSGPTENARLAGKFFGLDRAVQIEKGLTEELGKIQFLPLPGDPLLIRSTYDGLIEQRRHLKNEEVLNNWPPEGLEEEVDSLKSKISLWNSSRDNAIQVDRYITKRDGLLAQIESTREKHSTLEDSIAKIPVQRLRDLYIAESEKRRIHELHRGAQSRLDKLNGELQSIQASIAKSELNEKADFERIPVRIKELESLEAGNDVISREQKNLLEQAEQRDGVSCPVCLKPISWVESEIQPILDDQTKPRKDLASKMELDQLRKALAVIVKNRESRNQKLWSTLDAIERLELEKKEFGEDKGSGEPEKWEVLIGKYDDMRDELCLTQESLSSFESELSKLIAPNQLISENADSIDVVAAQLRLEEINQCEAEKIQIEHQRERLNILIVNAERDLKTVLEIQEKNAKASQYKERLIRLRRTFHPDGAPAELVGRRVARMEPRINEYLRALSVPFQARATTGFNFEYVFDDDPEFPRMAMELSGGQRTATSVAFRLAALSSFGASAGILALDEASQAMDEEKINLLSILLENLKPLAKQLNLTLLFITHQKELESSFDQVIQL